MKAKIWIFGFSFEHHGKFSAFHRLTKYLPDAIRKIHVKFPGARLFPRPLKHRVRAIYLQCAERRLIKEANRWRPRLIHFLYPENCFSCGCFQKYFNGSVMLTLHQPESILPGFISSRQGQAFIETAKRADRLIALAPHVVEGYQKFFQNSNVRIVPHGVDTKYFYPSLQTKKAPFILTVGNWMRDFCFWNEVTLEFLRQNRPEQFLLVTNRENIQRWGLKKRPNLDFQHRLSDHEIRMLYDQACCLFLPLTDAVANNALLEGLAMGKRILVTDLPATRFYAKDKATYMVHDRGVKEAASLLGQLLEANAKPEEGLSIRQYAVKAFAWQEIASLYLKEYNYCLSKK